MRTIAIMNLKGGVGKTVTALALGAALSSAGKRVLLVDCDGQMSLTRFYFYDLDPDNVTTVADVLQGTAEAVWEDNVLPILGTNIQLLPASSWLYILDVAAIQNGGTSGMALSHFRDAVAEDGEVDYMIFDCPPGFTAASMAALVAAQEVVTPVLIDGFGMRGTRDMAVQIEGIRRTNPSIKMAGALIVQWHKCDYIRQGEAGLRSLGLPVFNTVIYRSDKVPESTFSGKPILDYSPRSWASRDYRRWVKEYLGEGGDADGRI